MIQRSLLVLAWAAVCAACYDRGGPQPYVLVSPVLDSLFVGQQHPPATVTYYDGSGVPHAPGPITWSVSDPTIARIDATGQVTGLARGVVIEYATAQGVTGEALVVVSNTLDLTLLLDTIYLMVGDSINVPVAVLKQTRPPDPVVWYESLNKAVFTVDSLSGLVKALALGVAAPYVVHADTIADTGAVSVITLDDTLGGRLFFSVLGTAITHVGGPARAVNYRRTSGNLAFRFRGTAVAQQVVQITLPDSLNGTGSFGIDSITLNEATASLGPLDAICTPPRSWALWSAQSPNIIAYSRHDTRDSLIVTQNVALANNHGRVISGRFYYNTQRADLYSDPLGVLTVRGTFVAPLVTDRTSCP